MALSLYETGLRILGYRLANGGLEGFELILPMHRRADLHITGLKLHLALEGCLVADL